MTDATERILCIASYEKGQDFMRQCAELGVKPTVLTVNKLRDADWPRDVLEEVRSDFHVTKRRVSKVQLGCADTHQTGQEGSNRFRNFVLGLGPSGSSNYFNRL